MSKPVSSPLPLARRRQIIVKQLPDELLIYDLDSNRAHSLNESAAAIWNLCDGRTSVTEIAKQCRVKQDLVWMALDQFNRDQLLEEKVSPPPVASGLTRREAVRRIGLGAAIAIPVVVSITAPTPAQAATCRPSGSACTTSAQCCSGFCRGNNTCR